MPKIILDLENKLLEEARRQIEESGYGSLTIRSVAKGCGVGVGTVYNYFASKEVLLARFVLNDWMDCYAEISRVSESAETPEPVVRSIYAQIQQFVSLHQSIFQDKAAAASVSESFSSYHQMLRGHLAQPLRKFCAGDFAANFVAEAVLTWTLAGADPDDLWEMVAKLF